MADAHDVAGCIFADAEFDGQIEDTNAEQLDLSRVREVQRNSRSEKTLKAYKGMNIRFLKWAVANAGRLVALKSEGFPEEEWNERAARLSQDELHVEITHVVSKVLRMDERAFLGKISLEKLGFEAWAQFIVEQTKTDKDGNETYLANYGNYACALKHMFRCLDLPLPRWFETTARDFLKSLRREATRQRSSDPSTNHQRGNVALPFPFFEPYQRSYWYKGSSQLS